MANSKHCPVRFCTPYVGVTTPAGDDISIHHAKREWELAPCTRQSLKNPAVVAGATSGNTAEAPNGGVKLEDVDTTTQALAAPQPPDNTAGALIMPVAAPVPSPGQLLLHLGPKYIRFARDKDVREVAFGRPVPPRLVAEAFVLPTTHDNVAVAALPTNYAAAAANTPTPTPTAQGQVKPVVSPPTIVEYPQPRKYPLSMRTSATASSGFADSVAKRGMMPSNVPDA
ncbi:MAG: hypothetical protein L6R39_005246 [Caloplaca ligustica]|nr:MAG: hypothetical protein L6R39_005246 [Caloplaca ligustica]